MHDVVVMAVRKAVSAATTTFTAISTNFQIFSEFWRQLAQNAQKTAAKINFFRKMRRINTIYNTKDTYCALFKEEKDILDKSC